MNTNQLNNRVWLITGASSGFGKELAKVVTENGEMVAATFRNQSQADQFTDPDRKRLGVVIDVTKKEQIFAGVENIVQQWGQIDVLVNNAGYGALGSIEELTDAEIRRQFDVNVFGAIDVIKAVLPTMRKQRSGHIMNITSVGGIIGFTASGIYNASKFALEGIGHSLQLQVEHLGIKVTNVEPGPFRTNWAGRSASYQPLKIADYESSVGQNLAWMQSLDGKQAGDPVKAAGAIYELSLVENPSLKLPLGEYAYEAIENHYRESLVELKQFEGIGRATDYPVAAQ